VEVSLSEKMASTHDEIEKILNDLAIKAKPYAQKDMNELIDFMKSIHPNKENLELWDISYYSEKLKESKYELKDEELKPYFPLDGVLKGLFQLAQELFNVQIEEVNYKEENIHVWHPDVKFFHIYDYIEENNSKKHIASFYLDPYSRPGEKNGGAWMNVCVQKSKVMDKLPVAYLICNGSPPIQASENTCGKPSLMNFNEVVTLFHEFGHGLQHMLTKIEDSYASGIQNVEWDAVELPSQFMENWCYHEETLKSFAKHYETGEAIPSDLFQKIINQKNYHAGMLTLRQIYFGMMDT
jgi:oligopeptidase A